MESYILLTPIYIAVAYLFRACFTDPNPVAPKKPEPLGINAVVNTFCKCVLATALCFGPSIISMYAVLLSGFRAAHSEAFHTFCPLQSESVLDITPRKAFGFALAFTAGLIRLECYRELGASFRFDIRAPTILITGGVYKYARHPSYTCVWLLAVAVKLLFQDRNGLIGCFVASPQESLMDWSVVALIPVLAFIRVKDEENTLREAFGRQWDQYERKTAKFIPWVL